MNAKPKFLPSLTGPIKSLAVALLLAPVVCISAVMAFAATSNTASAETCSRQCLRVYSIDVSDLGGSIRGIVKLIDETGAADSTRGSVVHAVWTRPDGSTFDQYANIGTRLRAQFSLYTGAVPGTYTLTVVGATKTGYTFDALQSSVLSHSITVGDTLNEPPTAVPNADFTSGSAPLTVNFDSSRSIDSDGVIVDYAWNFGDGHSSNEANPVHTYTDIGSFNASLTVTDNSGATATSWTAIMVTDSDTGCLSKCLAVDNVSLSYNAKSRSVKGLVGILDENNGDVRNATVHATWTLPDGSTVDQYSKAGKSTSANFTIKATSTGRYTLSIVEVTHPAYTFDPDSSNVLAGSIDITP